MDIINGIPACFHPTTVLLLDDDAALTESITLKCQSTSRCVSFTSPQAALDTLKNYHPKSFTTNCIQQNEEYDLDERSIHVEIPNIYKHIYNPERFNEISVMVVDYAMPGMNGVEFCKAAKNINCMKIMLTGEADEKQGIDAFNAKLIDMFHKKGEADIYKTICQDIKTKQIEYFQKLSHIIISSLSNSPDHPPACILDHSLVNPFFDLLAANNIAEYYLYSNDGYFLTLDYDGNIKWLVIHDDKEMDALAELAESIHLQEPSKPSKKVVDSIKAKNRIALFIDKDDTNIDCASWGPFLQPASKMRCGEKSYYYAFFNNDPEKFPLDKIVQFDH